MKLFFLYFIYLSAINCLELKVKVGIEAQSEETDASQDLKINVYPEKLEDLDPDEYDLLSQFKFHYNEYKPLNFYDLNPQDPQYNRILREQIFRNNTHFFDKPLLLQKKERDLRKKYNLPQDENIKQQFNKDMDIFDNSKLNDYFKKFYIENGQKNFEIIKKMSQINFRFLETEGKSGLQLFQDNVKSEKRPLPLYSCWASSRLDRMQRHSYFCMKGGSLHQHHEDSRDFAGYPCKSFIEKNVAEGYWMSGPITGHAIGRNIYFRADFGSIKRIQKMLIKWLGTPSEWKLQTTQEMIIWQETVTMEDKGEKWEGEDGAIILNTPVFSRGIRLIMKTSERYIGFTNIEIYEETFTGQLQNKCHQDMCLSKQEADFYNPGGGVQLIPCVNAVIMGDARDIFVFDFDGQIKSYVDKFCLQIMEDRKIKTQPCTGSPYQKWQMLANGEISATAVKDLCLVSVPESEDVAEKGEAYASSEYDHMSYPVNRANDGNPGSFWMSQANIPKQWIQVYNLFIIIIWFITNI